MKIGFGYIYRNSVDKDNELGEDMAYFELDIKTTFRFILLINNNYIHSPQEVPRSYSHF
jgi:hypothetical protein